MKRKGIFVAALISIVLSTQIYSQRAEQNSAGQVELEKILKKCVEYCVKLGNSALDFVCIEEINEKINRSREITPRWVHSYSDRKPIEKNKYIYDYQFIKKRQKMEETRILLKENGKKKNEKNADLKTRAFIYQNILFGPVELIDKIIQQRYDYSIRDEELIKGEKAVVIEAVPKPGNEQGYLPYGKIWIKKSDFSILRIEWNQRTVRSFEMVEKTAELYNAEPKIVIFTEFNFEKNGIRFPSKHVIIEMYVDKDGSEFIRSETTVTYKDYKFFTVETEVKYERRPI